MYMLTSGGLGLLASFWPPVLPFKVNLELLVSDGWLTALGVTHLCKRVEFFSLVICMLIIIMIGISFQKKASTTFARFGTELFNNGRFLKVLKFPLTVSLIVDHIALIWKLDNTASLGNIANINIFGLHSVYFRNWQYFRIVCLSQSWKHRRCERWVIIRKFHMSKYFPSHSIRTWALERSSTHR